MSTFFKNHDKLSQLCFVIARLTLKVNPCCSEIALDDKSKEKIKGKHKITTRSGLGAGSKSTQTVEAVTQTDVTAVRGKLFGRRDESSHKCQWQQKVKKLEQRHYVALKQVQYTYTKHILTLGIAYCVATCIISFNNRHYFFVNACNP